MQISQREYKIKLKEIQGYEINWFHTLNKHKKNSLYGFIRRRNNRCQRHRFKQELAQLF